MTSLALRDRLAARGWFRACLACAVAVLAIAVALHHGGVMGEMPHGAMPAAPAQPVGATSAEGHAHSQSTHVGHQHADMGSVADAPAPHGHEPAHGMVMSVCLAILAAGVLCVVLWVRRVRVRRRATPFPSVRGRGMRAPVVLAPAAWRPPPRGAPSLPLVLCVVRR